MYSSHFHRVLTLIILVVLTVSCVPKTTPGMPTVTTTGYPSLPTTTPRIDAPISVTPPADSTHGAPSTPKPPRSTQVPGGKQGQGQGKGSNASQNISFEVPSHSFDTILGRPTADSIVISLLSATDQALSISYGTDSGIYTAQTGPIALQANIPTEVTLSNLAPDTTYYYSIEGVENTFHTARPPGATFTFTIQSDSHLDSNSSLPVYQQALANQRADQPDFVIDLGDTFMTDKYKPYTAAAPQYLAQRYYLGQLANTAPLFLVLGNHDGEGAMKNRAANEMSIWSAQLRTEYFPNPVPDSFYTGNTTPHPTVGDLQNYYAWEWGDALFVVLDPYWFTPSAKGNTTDMWGPTLGAEQYQWLKTTLETSDARWKFVFIHQLLSGVDKNGRGGVEVANLYEWGGHDPDGSYSFDKHRPGWGLPIHPLLVANHVSAVFHGHDHLFVKQELDGIIYQEVPQPSTARPNNTSSATEYNYLTGDAFGSPGHIRVTVSPDGVTVEYVRAYLPEDENNRQTNGQVDSEYTIP